MNYSVNYLTLSPTHTDVCMEDLQDFDAKAFSDALFGSN